MNKMRHVGVYVKDLEKMVSFYKEIFGLQIVVHQQEKGTYTDTIFGEKNVSIEVYKLEFNNKTIMEFVHYDGADDLPNWEEKLYKCSKMHVAVTVDSASEIYQKLKKKGCILLSEPSVSPDGNVKVFFARDIEGNYLELVEEL